MSLKKSTSCSKGVDNVMCFSLLDLPDLVLDCILEKLPPQGLCTMSSVCTSLKEKCTDDYLWEIHMKQKWGQIVGAAAHREWQCQIASRKDSAFFNNQTKQPKGLLNYLSHIWPFSLLTSSSSSSSKPTLNIFPPVDSVMSKFLALDCGKFWFPAQVSNRENGQSGFMLSCYDAEVSYNPRNDTFQARYPTHGNRAIAMEIGVTWDRLRAPPVDTPPHHLHLSDCLSDLNPGDHIEIQWRKNKEFPYGWWYGVVGHMKSCDGIGNPSSFCHCHKSDTVVLEFKQYTKGSRWRRTILNRKNHTEEGNEDDGFYGGIRKIHSNSEILTWKKLWPPQNLE